jgi:hypothetical protein
VGGPKQDFSAKNALDQGPSIKHHLEQLGNRNAQAHAKSY